MKSKNGSSQKDNKRERPLKKMQSEMWTIAEIAIHYKPQAMNQQQIGSIEETHERIRKLWDHEKICIQEQFMAFFFNTNNRIIGFKLISTGTMKCCIVDVKLVCALALHSLSTSVVIAHNHPSGNLKPSKNDFAITVRMQEALKLIEVDLLDHFILTENGYLSFAESGFM